MLRPSQHTSTRRSPQNIEMQSPRSAAARRARSSICARCLYRNTSRSFTFSTKSELPTGAYHRYGTTTPRHRFQPSLRPPFSSGLLAARHYSVKTTADSAIEDIQEQYATARDEFEIASEETEKKSVYAAGDRAAAREELEKLKAMYEEALSGGDGVEIKNRVGQRIRELDNAVLAMEKSAIED